MTTKEIVWRHLLTHRDQYRWQQKEVAAALGLVPSAVHAALEVPRRAGAVAVGGRGFEVLDWPKLTVIWAVFRDLPRDVLWTVRLRGTAGDVEGEMIPEAVFTGPSAWKFARDFAPADYDHVLVYLPAEHLPALRERIAPLEHRRGATSLTALRPDRLLPNPAPLEQVYVDLWQLPEWWAAEFLRAIREAWGWADSTTTTPSQSVAGSRSSSYVPSTTSS